MDGAANVFDQFGFDDAGSPQSSGSSNSGAPSSSSPSGNVFDKFGFDDGHMQPAAPAPRGTAADIAESAGAGVIRGAAGLAGLPGDAQQSWNTIWDRAALAAAHKAFDWTGHGPQAGTPEREQFDKAYMATSSGQDIASDVMSKGGIPSPENLPTSHDITGAVEKATGELPTPQTRAGRFAETFGEFLPAAAGGPGGLARKVLVDTAIPAAATQAADEVTRGSPYEDAARLGTAAVTGVGLAGLEEAAGRAKDYIAPMNRVGFQRPIDLGDGTTAQNSYGEQLTATKGQARVAGQTLTDRAADPAAVRASLADGPQELVPGSRPTTYQATGDYGLGQLERKVSLENPAPFIQRADEQNAARVAHLNSIQSFGSPVDVANNFRAARDAMDAEHSAALTSAQQAVQDAGRNIGGIGSTPESIGSGLRDPLVQARAQAKTQEDQLWSVVPKDMVLPGGPIADAAKSISSELTPSATPMAGEEARIFNVASQYGDSTRFQEVRQLRSSISTAMRAAQQSGDSQSLRRLTMLRGAVENSIDHGVENQAALDQISVRRGTMAPEDTMEAQVAALQQKWGTQFGAARAYAGNELASTGTGAGRVSTGRATGFAGTGGTTSPNGGGPVRSASDQGVPPPPPIDAEAAGRLKAASAATRQRAETFDTGVVGKALDRGPGNTFTQSDARVGQTIFHKGPTGGEDLRAYFKAGGSKEAAVEAAAASLRDHAGRNDGTFDGPAIHRWIGDHETAINELPPEFRDRYEHSIEAQNLHDEVVAKQKDREAAFKRSAVAPFLNLTEPESVTRQVGAIFGQKNAAETMQDLAKRTADDPAARDGLRRAIVDHIQGRFIGTNQQIKGQSFNDFFRLNKHVLQKVFTEDEANKLSVVANDIERAKQSAGGTRLKTGGSDTQQNRLLTHPSSSEKSILSNVITQGIMTLGGDFMLGKVGAMAGWLGHHTVGGMRDAGITRINHLVTEAMLDPKLARALMERVPEYKDTGTAAALGLTLRRAVASQAYGPPPKRPEVGDDGTFKSPPVPHAQRASDGQWYAPDPVRPGKFVRLDPVMP